LFPNFPYTQFPSSDERLNRIIKNHGGWLRLLDPNTKVDELEGLLTELRNAGFSADELVAIKALLATGEREKLLLHAAVLHRKAQLGTSNPVDERLLSGLDASLQLMQITPQELQFACEHLAPHAMKWFKCDS
jgi:hypothetical protein